MVAWVRRAVWAERFTYGSVRGLGVKFPFTYSTLFVYQFSASISPYFSSFLMVETKLSVSRLKNIVKHLMGQKDVKNGIKIRKKFDPQNGPKTSEMTWKHVSDIILTVFAPFWTPFVPLMAWLGRAGPGLSRKKWPKNRKKLKVWKWSKTIRNDEKTCF